MEPGVQPSKHQPPQGEDAFSPVEYESVASPVQPVSPPYWHVDDVAENRDILASLRSNLASGQRRGHIVLEDHTEEDSDQNRACWARAAKIDDHTLIGSKMGVGALGAYVVFNCVIETANVSGQDDVRKCTE
jgi:hypothetical protein